MHSLTPDYFANLRFDTHQLATLRALGEYRGKQRFYVAQSPEVLSGLRQVAMVESAESSNRFEGVVVTIISIAEAKHTEAQTPHPAAWAAFEYAHFSPIEEASA